MSSDEIYDYSKMDPSKVRILKACRSTARFAERRGFFPDMDSFGESVLTGELRLQPGAQVVITGGLLESLGTKNIVADDYQTLTGISFHDQTSRDNCEMVFNDSITLGALPFQFNQLMAVGSDSYYPSEKEPETYQAKDERMGKLISGTVHACAQVSAVYAGGESPVLVDNVTEKGAVFAGSCSAIIREPRFKMSGSKIRHGDLIYILRSSGVHSNGISDLRKLAARLPQGYLTKLSDGRTFGEAILDATLSYTKFIEDCQDEGIDLHYAANITGHGLAKIQRAVQPFRYVIKTLHEPHPIFPFIKEHTGWDYKKLLNKYNWGNGFAVFASEKDADAILKVAADLGLEIIVAGDVETSKASEVYIEPLDIRYDELAIR